MNKVQVTVRANRRVYQINPLVGTTLLRAMREEKVPVLAMCDGNLSCATCHVYIDKNWVSKLPPAAEDEEDMLDLAPDPGPNSRLACQIILTPELNGLTLEIAPSALIET